MPTNDANATCLALAEGVNVELLKTQLEALGYEVSSARGSLAVKAGQEWLQRPSLFDDRLQLIADASPTLMVISRRSDGLLLFANQALAEFANVPLDDLVGRIATAYYKDPADRERFTQALGRDGFVKAMELDYVRFDGVVRTLSVSVFPVELEGEALLVGSGIDVTDTNETAQELRKTAEHLQIVLREVNHRVLNNLGALLALMSHERRKLSHYCCAEELDSWLRLERKVRALAAVHTLLSNSMWNPISATRLCHDTVASTCQGAEEPPRIRTHGRDFELDSEQAQNLGLVLSELALNSLKHGGRPKDLTLRIQVSNEDSAAVIVYRDNGEGYPAHVQKEPLNGGEGLQLVVAIINQSLGGEVTFRSEQGAVTTMRFPLVDSRDAVDSPPTA